jgi:hypothetical protein
MQTGSEIARNRTECNYNQKSTRKTSGIEKERNNTANALFISVHEGTYESIHDYVPPRRTFKAETAYNGHVRRNRTTVVTWL